MALTKLSSAAYRRFDALGGELRIYTGSDPAANNEFSETVPAGKVWRLLSVLATFTADANVATRTPRLVLDDGTNVFARYSSVGTIAAGGSAVVNWVNTEGSAYSSAGEIVPIPDFLLPAGFRVSSIVNNRQVGDDWSAPVFYVVEYSA